MGKIVWNSLTGVSHSVSGLVIWARLLICIPQKWGQIPRRLPLQVVVEITNRIIVYMLSETKQWSIETTIAHRPLSMKDVASVDAGKWMSHRILYTMGWSLSLVNH